MSLAPRVMTNTESKTRNASSVRNSSATRIDGLISGSVILKKRWNALAPSTFAALQQLLGHEREPGEQQQRHERRRLPDLREDDHDERAASASVSGGVSRLNQVMTKPGPASNA